jgi:hypothetical protein
LKHSRWAEKRWRAARGLVVVGAAEIVVLVVENFLGGHSMGAALARDVSEANAIGTLRHYGGRKGKQQDGNRNWGTHQKNPSFKNSAL